LHYCISITHGELAPVGAAMAVANNSGVRSFRVLTRLSAALAAGGCLRIAAAMLPFWIMTLGGESLSADQLEDARKLYRTGKFVECIGVCDLAIEDASNREDWYELLLLCQLASGRYEDALQSLDYGLIADRNSIRLRWLGHQVCRVTGDTYRSAQLLLELEEYVRYRNWRYRDAANRVVQARYAIERRVDARQILDELLTPASLLSPEDPSVWLAIADLALANNDYALAADNYRKAIALAEDDPAGHMGLAQSFRTSDPAAANESLQRALAINSEFVPALLYLVEDRINSEQYDEAELLIARMLAVNPHDTDAWSCRAVLANLANDPQREATCRREAFGAWPGNPRVDYLIGRKLSQKYRFAEGARHQRRALDCDPLFLPAKLQLANDLLRLGNDEEGWRLASEVYRDDGYNVVAYNLVTLGREMDGYAVLDRDGFIVRMDPHEAAIFGDRVLQILDQAKKTLSEKYRMEVATPVFVEIFPHQKDFAIRTFGLPGGQGFLGVCFGHVITMNSPSSRSTGNSNWESVLWHEFCHVVTLQKTGNKMPRWLSEGISVYEELEANPGWGQVMTPRYREMILNGELTPVSQLSAAFLDPPSPEHLQFAYFESSLVVRFLIERYGLETMHQVLDDLETGMPANDVLGRRTGGITLLDREFAAYAAEQAQLLAAGMDWTRPAPEQIASIALCQKWNTEHPDNWYGLRREAALHLHERDWSSARPLLLRLTELYPDYRGDDNAWNMLASVARGEGDVESEISMLQKSATLSASGVDVFKRLSGLLVERRDWPAVSSVAAQWVAVDPVGPVAWEMLALAAESAGKYGQALTPLKVLTQLDPVDPADILYRYAVALHKTGDRNMARRQLLKCLENAPRYQAAHQLLLELTADEPPPDNGGGGAEGFRQAEPDR
jgi:tetratricopeptide (TPR) repeat protein